MEQTSSTLYGLAISLQAVSSGRATGDLDRINNRLDSGLARLIGFQDKNGLFSLWCGMKSDPAITALVAYRLLAFKSLPHLKAHRMLRWAVNGLLRLGFKDNRLAGEDTRFRDELRTLKDAVALYFHGNGERDRALDYLRQNVRASGRMAHWPAPRQDGYWGGELEATCDAARVMLAAGDPLFAPAFNYVGSKLTNGRLFSTADTRALVELLSFLSVDAKEALIDGQRQILTRQCLGQEVRAVGGPLLARIDEERPIDWFAPVQNFAFQVQLNASAFKPGQRAALTIVLRESSLCPAARISLPGCLAFLQGGANAQTAYLPVGVNGWHAGEAGHLDLEAVAIRRGSGRILIAVHDLYDSDKIGTITPLEVQVE